MTEKTNIDATSCEGEVEVVRNTRKDGNIVRESGCRRGKSYTAIDWIVDSMRCRCGYQGGVRL